jgi:RNA polymerase sigma factor (sigma-70 family)
VAAIRSGADEAAIEEVVRRHGPMVLRVCRRALGHAQDAEDAFQATFVVLLRRAGRIGKPDSLGSWLHGVAVRVSRELLAARRRRAEPLATDPAASPSPCPVEQADLAAVVDAEVAGLPGHYRAPVVLCELQGRSRRDAARELGVPEGTLSSRLATAKRLLADRLAGRGLLAATLGAVLSGEAVAARVPAELAARTARLLVGVAAGDSVAGVVPAEVDRVANGVVSTMIVSKLRGPVAGAALLVVALGVLAAAGSGPVPPAPVPSVPLTVAAHQAPKAVPDNLIWVQYKTGKLVALTPPGQAQKEITLKDGPLVMRVSPAAGRLWFAGQDGRSVEANEFGRWPEGRLTLHARGIDDKTTGEDLGVEVTESSVLSPDGKTLGLVKLLQTSVVGTDNDRPFIFENSLIDVATKKVTKLDVPGNHQLFGIAPNGSWVLTFEYTFPPEKGTPPYRLNAVPLPGGKPRLLSGTLNAAYGSTISPDGTRVLVFAEDLKGKEKADWVISAYVIDVATAKATRIGGDPKQLWSVGVWSPDGKRIAYAWRAANDDGEPINSNGVPPTRLVVCDADGKNSATVLTADEDFHVVAWW